jgi:Ca2+-binding EF-hand superfamily protein
MRVRSIVTGGVLAMVAVLAFVAHPAAAADKPAPDFEKVFKRKDANGDGKLTIDEFKTGMKDKALANADKRFKRVDANGDGAVSLDEFKAGMQPKQAK